MKLENFTPGVWKKQYQYKSFSPAFINHDWTWDDPRINVLLESATRALGELNAFSLIVPDVDRFIQMHIFKEANTSSRIEGTRTEMADALLPEEAVPPEMKNDWREVRNYVDAMNMAVDELTRLPLSNRLACMAHALLMRSARGEHKQPGEIRTSQNWIGGAGPMDAAFVPPHPMEVPELMSDLEKFLHNKDISVPILVRAAIAHYQFETIHPFNDGNGRIGRLLIPLFLISEGVLAKPSLYLSDFFERNRSSYIDALMRARTANDLNHWVRFFLSGVLETATKGRDVFRNILVLREETDALCMTLGKRAHTARETINLLYRNPQICVKDIEEGLGISSPTAHAIVRDFARLGILIEVTGQQRGRIFVFERYLKAFLS